MRFSRRVSKRSMTCVGVSLRGGKLKAASAPRTGWAVVAGTHRPHPSLSRSPTFAGPLRFAKLSRGARQLADLSFLFKGQRRI